MSEFWAKAQIEAVVSEPHTFLLTGGIFHLTTVGTFLSGYLPLNSTTIEIVKQHTLFLPFSLLLTHVFAV